MPAEGDAYHLPVLLEEAVTSLNCGREEFTLMGRWAAEDMRLCPGKIRSGRFSSGMDVDSEALEAAEKRLVAFGRRKRLVKANYADIRQVLTDQKIMEIDGILLDLGVSSHQLDTPERGFSFLQRRHWICAWILNPAGAPTTSSMAVRKES